MQNKKRYFVLITVAGTHALVLSMLFSASRISTLPSSRGRPITAFILTRAARRHPPVERPRLNVTSAPIVPVVKPISLAPPTPAVTSQSRRAIDWNAAARRAARAQLERGKRISFGFPPGGKGAITLGVPSPPSPAHHAGESDRTVSGEAVQWTSDHCYVVSDPPLPGEPDFLKHARVMRAGCQPRPGPDPGELFKSLRAYKKHHPQ